MRVGGAPDAARADAELLLWGPLPTPPRSPPGLAGLSSFTSEEAQAHPGSWLGSAPSCGSWVAVQDPNPKEDSPQPHPPTRVPAGAATHTLPSPRLPQASSP